MNKRSIAVSGILLILGIGIILFYRFSFGQPDLAAIDKNGNGIWDDYEIVLTEKYKNTRNIRSAALQTGKTLQALLDSSDVLKKDKDFAKAMSCLVAAGLQDGLSPLEATDLIDQVRDIAISNEARQQRYIKYNAEVSGKMLPVEMPDIGNCEFQVQGSQK